MIVSMMKEHILLADDIIVAPSVFQFGICFEFVQNALTFRLPLICNK